MAWADFQDGGPSVTLLRRSLERGRLGHAYLFSGESSGFLEGLARELACTVNCMESAERSADGFPVAACSRCTACRRIRDENHPDVHWLRAESKLRVVKIEQVRQLMRDVQLKPGEGRYKVGIVVGADRLNSQAANAFLKTLEEPPARSLLILLSTEPDRLLETILSRCLRLSFLGETRPDEADLGWLRALATGLQQPAPSLLTRYRLLDELLRRLTELRAAAERDAEARSPAPQHVDADPEVLGQWEDETKAAIEAEYRRRRGQLFQALEWWLRDVWLTTLGQPVELLGLSELARETGAIAARLDPARALANLELVERTQRTLHTNVQEALAIEVALLKLNP